MAEKTKERVVNGVNVEKLGEILKDLREAPELARFRTHVRGEWLGGGHSRFRIASFHGMGKEIPHRQTYTVEADEPAALLGTDEAPNPIEHLLVALGSCLTGAVSYHAAARGIEISQLETLVEGEIDLRGFTGVSEDVPKGYQKIMVTFRMKTDATEDTLRECADFSPVYRTMKDCVPIELKFEML
ncbi:MAG: OsmC family protein [Planctomycetota bacterium]